MEKENKGIVCVTGGTGFVASWLIFRLLQRGYTVHTTIRPHPNIQGQDSKKDTSFLTTLPGATERLRIFEADLDKPDSFNAAIKGCIGVFHVATPMDFTEIDTAVNKSINGTLGILQACLNSKTVKRVVCTSSIAAVLAHNKEDLHLVDENSWTDVDYLRTLAHNGNFGAAYSIVKTLTEKAALEFGQKHALDVVSVIPCWIHGPFVCPRLPGSVISSLSMIIGNTAKFKYTEPTAFVHNDDVANAHIFLFEYPDAKGRYICSSVEITFDKLAEFLSTRYPEFQLGKKEDLVDKEVKFTSLSSKKLLDTGFRYKYGLEEMFDDAIRCCREKGLL